MISGTPTTPNTYNVVITVTDSQSPAAKKSTPYTIKVTIGALVITSAAPPPGTVGAAYAGGGFSLAASGGVGPYIWSWAPAAGSTLPPGLILANATISGMPATPGTYNVVITVTDSQSPTMHTSSNYAITVANQAALLITSGNPPPGTIGVKYVFGSLLLGFPLSASGGVSPYHFSWAGAAGSSTPPGLGVTSFKHLPNCPRNGWEICGVPTTLGTYNVVITLSDSASPQNQASANYSITIRNPPPPSSRTFARHYR